MTVRRFQLGVDFGTSNTVAVLDGRPLLFDGAPVLPSAVCVDRPRGLLVGRDAVHSAGTMPEGYEPYPKRRIDDGTVLLGRAEVPVTALIAAVLRRVADEARTVTGDAPLGVALTYPVAWAAPRQQVLRDAARLAGLGGIRLVPEPVAAANYFAANAGVHLPVGACAVVYDIGAGTFDVSVVRRTASGFEVVTADGLDDGGGLDLDAAIVAQLGATYAARDPAAWTRLTAPATPADQRAARALWDQVRTGKEMLSRASSTYIHLPLLDLDAPLGREQFDALAAPVLDRTVVTTIAVLQRAGINPATLGGVFLVGGASRSPLVATLLHRALGVAPRVIDQPEMAVAQGSLIGATAPSSAGGPVPAGPGPLPAAPVSPSVTAGPMTPVSVAPASGPFPAHSQAPISAVPASPVSPASPAPAPAPPVHPQRPARPGRRLAVVGALVLVLAVAAALVLPQLLDRSAPGATDAGPTPSTSAPSSPGASASPSVDQPDPDATPGQEWAASEQFMEISGGEVRGGEVFLNVRVATKEHLGESFETIPGTGPFVEVKASQDARAIRVQSDRRGPTSDMERLVADLADRKGDDVEEGFDVTFSAFGLVQQVEWQFNPGS